MRVLLLLFVFLLVGQAKCLDPEINCPEYVFEGRDLSCNCMQPQKAFDIFPDFSLKWYPGPGSPILTVPNVTRNDSGRQFSCQMTLNAKQTFTPYTLKVAYGPANVTINGPSSFTTDGSLSLTLTCTAVDTYPTPVYSWGNVHCDSNNTQDSCTFRPVGERDNGKQITCTVTNKVRDQIQTKYTLRLLYPPSRPPVIQNAANGKFIEKGDLISCVVSGGNPPVKSVILGCSNPQLVYRLESHNGSTVSTSLAFVSSARISGSLECYCHGVWEPNTDFYRYNESYLFNIKEHNEKTMETSEAGSNQFPVAWVAVGVVAENVILVIILSLVCSRRSKKAVKEAMNQEKPEHPYCSVKVNDRISLDMTGESSLPLYPRMDSAYVHD